MKRVYGGQQRNTGFLSNNVWAIWTAGSGGKGGILAAVMDLDAAFQQAGFYYFPACLFTLQRLAFYCLTFQWSVNQPGQRFQRQALTKTSRVIIAQTVIQEEGM